jgi:hypothetical protein
VARCLQLMQGAKHACFKEIFPCTDLTGKFARGCQRALNSVSLSRSREVEADSRSRAPQAVLHTKINLDGESQVEQIVHIDIQPVLKSQEWHCGMQKKAPSARTAMTSA